MLLYFKLNETWCLHHKIDCLSFSSLTINKTFTVQIWILFFSSSNRLLLNNFLNSKNLKKNSKKSTNFNRSFTMSSRNSCFNPFMNFVIVVSKKKYIIFKFYKKTIFLLDGNVCKKDAFHNLASLALTGTPKCACIDCAAASLPWP